MTKTELIQQVAEQAGVSQAQAGKIVNATFEAISKALGNGEDVRLTGFGTFRVAESKERTGRNPRTGEALQIPAQRRPAFSAGSQLVETVRGQGAKEGSGSGQA
jgi:DNA-binding protein HU-beta